MMLQTRKLKLKVERLNIDFMRSNEINHPHPEDFITSEYRFIHTGFARTTSGHQWHIQREERVIIPQNVFEINKKF